MRKADLQYYRNAGIQPKKPPKPMDYAVDGLDRAKQAVQDTASLPKRIIKKAKDTVATIKRGHELYDQGYGNRRDSAFEIARKGTSEGRKRPPKKQK